MSNRLMIGACASGAICLLLAAQVARADTGTQFTCNVEHEPTVTIYLDTAGKLATFEQGGSRSADVTVKNGRFRAKIAHRLLEFVPVWSTHSYTLTIARSKEAHVGSCRMP